MTGFRKFVSSFGPLMSDVVLCTECHLGSGIFSVVHGEVLRRLVQPAKPVGKELQRCNVEGSKATLSNLFEIGKIYLSTVG